MISSAAWRSFAERQEWREIEKFLDQSIELARSELEKLGIPERQADSLRGEIFRLKSLKDLPGVKAEQAEIYEKKGRTGT